MSAKDYDKLGSTIVALGNNFATTEADIVAMAQNLASAGTQVGMTQSDIMALATALSSVGLEAQAGGTAFSKALINMQLAVETNSESLKDWADVAGMSTKEFADLFKKDATSALKAFIKGLSNCKGETKSAIKVLDDMGITETRMRDALLRSANASDIFTEAIEMGSDAWEDNTALTNEANKRYDTLKSKITVAINKLKDMAITIGNKLMPHIEKIIDKFGKWVEKFESLSDEQVDMIVKIGLVIAAIGPLLTILGKVTSTIGGTIKGIGTFTQAIGVVRGKITSTSTAVNGLAGIMKSVFSPTGLAIGAVVAGVAILNSATEETTKYVKECEEGLEKTLDEKQAIDELRTSIDKNAQSNLEQINQTQSLWVELQKITDENGKIKEGYENRAKVITGELSKALGTEITITDNVIDKYKELQGEIDTLILKKKSEIILSASEEKYSEAIKNREQKTQELIDAEEKYNTTLKNRDEMYNSLTEAEKKCYEAAKEGKSVYLSHEEMMSINNAKITNLSNIDKSVEDLKTNVSTLKTVVNDYTNDIADYEYNLELSMEGSTEAIQKMIDNVGNTYTENGKTVELTYQKKIKAQQIYLQQAMALNEEAIKNNNETELKKSQTTIEESNRRLETLIEELKGMTSATEENSPEIIQAWTQLATGSYATYYDQMSKLPEELSKKIQEMTGVTAERTPELVEETQKMMSNVLAEVENNQEFKQKAIENMQGFLSGLSDEDLRQLLRDAGIENVEEVIEGIKKGNLAEAEGQKILGSLQSGLNNQSWKNSLWTTARNIASTLSGLLTVRASVNGNVAALPGHKLGLDYVPKDNYVARLHKGERVLTAEENKNYTEAEESSRKSPNYSAINTTKEINYNKIAEAFLKALNSCKLTLDEDGFVKFIRNELYEVI